MNDLREFLIGLLVLDLIIVNVVAGYLLYQKLNTTNIAREPDLSKEISVEPEPTLAASSCTERCTQIIDDRIAEFQLEMDPNTTNEQETSNETLTIQPTTAPATQSTSKTVSYVPVPGSGNTINNEWVTLDGTDFYLSKSDYDGIKEVYFEANMYLKNGNGTAYLRLFDMTHGVGVDGSQVETSSQNSTFVSSGKISLWDGYNHYVVQARSLTADTTHFESGRLKIIQEY